MNTKKNFCAAAETLIDKKTFNLYHGEKRLPIGGNWMEGTLKLAGLILGATAINLPLGYLRYAYERFTFGWFFYVHISIPIIIYLRIKASFSWQVVPLTLAGALVGQFLGGVLRRRRDSHG